MKPDEIVEVAKDIQERLAGLPLLPGEDLARIADSIDAPVLVRDIDLSDVLAGPTMAFLLAGPDNVDGTPAFLVDRTMAEFWDHVEAPTFKAYRAACEKAWTTAGLPETDVDRMSELLTREARERQVHDDTPVQRDAPAGPDSRAETGARATAESADFMTAAELDAALAPSWDDGPQAVTRIMEAAGWKRQSISTDDAVIARPHGRDPLRMLVSKDGQLNGVMISEKPEDGDFQRLADQMADLVTTAVGAPAGGEADGKRTWQVPGRTIAVGLASTTVDLTIVRNGTKPFVE